MIIMNYMRSFIIKRIIGISFLFPLVFIAFSCSKDNNFNYTWENENNRIWAGSDFWANRLQDWHISNGRIETRVSEFNLPLRTLHLLTAQMAENNGKMDISLHTGLSNVNSNIPGNALTGVLIGAGGTNLDYRAASLVHNTSAPIAGFLVGLTSSGKLYIENNAALPPKIWENTEPLELIRNCRLKISVNPENDTTSSISLKVLADKGNMVIDQLEVNGIESSLLTGNIAIVSHPGTGRDPANFWFSDIQVSGNRIMLKPEQEFGPIAFSMYTLSRNILKMSVQMMPLGNNDPNTINLQVYRNSKWETVDTASFSYPDYTALFRIENWDDTMDHQYRLAYNYFNQGVEKTSYMKGIIRKEPLSSDTLKTVSIACVGHNMSGIEEGGRLPGWTHWNYGVFTNMRKVWDNDHLYTTENIWFPHQKLINNLTYLNPDILFFLGDQVYEFRPTRPEYENGEITMLDYLYKWYLWGWSFKDVISNRPTVCMIDDHDVYQGNIWGDGGRKPPQGSDRWRQGGYTESPEFVNMVQRTQTIHLPDPFDPTPVEQGIDVYYTSLDYGGVSFSIMEDRKFKSIPDTSIKNLALFGSRQLEFLDHWVTDWNKETDFKVCMTQSLLACVNTQFGEINKDYDTNGWPVEGRNNALKILRKGFSFMIGGDQHLSTVVHHGTDQWDDAGYSVIAPAIGCVYPRFWQPKVPALEPDPSGKKFLGRYLDAFGNKVNVKAVANPSITGIPPVAQNDLGVGYIVVDFIKSSQQINIEHWPVSTDLTDEGPTQYAGWPISLNLKENYSREVFGHLPKMIFKGIQRPYIRVVNEATGEMVYNRRIHEKEFTPAVFEDGVYTVLVGESSEEILEKFSGLEPVSNTQVPGTEILVNIP